jgi:hypothetical protein
MQKNTREVAFNIDYIKAKEIRSQLLLWRFRRLSDLRNVGSEGNEQKISGISNGLNFVDGRFAELYTPLLFVSDNSKEAILSYAHDEYRHMIEEEGTSIEAEIVECLIKCNKFVKNGWIATRIITNMFNEEKPKNEQWKSSSIGRYMKKLGFRSSRRSNGAGWLYDQKRIKRLSKRYNISLPEHTLDSLHSFEV